jgi:POT family proton-dependent oligopeptide transporter
MADKPRHPPGLKVLFFTEMWERFSFYLMLAILPLYLADKEKGGMGWTDEQAAVLVGSYIALVYFTPFIGGLLADRLLGCRRTILIGGTLMMIGHLILAIPGEIGLYLGLLFLILGNGAFKPNISTLVGNLYPPGSPLKGAGYNIFYMGINLGAFICTFVAAFARNYFDNHPIMVTSNWEIRGWHAAFGTAGIGMFFGLIIFSSYYRHLAYADPDPRTVQSTHESLRPLWFQCLIPAALLGALGWVLADYFGKAFPLKNHTAAFVGACIPVFVFYFNIWRKMPHERERSRVSVLLVIYGACIVFWMIFHLNTTVLNVWARDNTDRDPNRLVRVLTEAQEEFAENAPPKYFVNAGKEVPRPARETYVVVSVSTYEQLEKDGKLSVKDGEKVYVTQKTLDRIYDPAREDPSIRLQETGEHVKLANTELFQSINAGYVILFTPLLVSFWHFLRQRGLEPSTPAKIGLGLLLAGGSPVVMLLATWASGDGAQKVSSWWLFATYAVATVAELCLSPMGLTLVSKISPQRLKAFMMGGWFLSTSFGNKLSGIFGELYHTTDHYVFWLILLGSAVVFSSFIFALLPWLNRQMGDEDASS